MELLVVEAQALASLIHTIWILALIGYILNYVSLLKGKDTSTMLEVIFIITTWHYSVAWGIALLVWSTFWFLVQLAIANDET